MANSRKGHSVKWNQIINALAYIWNSKRNNSLKHLFLQSDVTVQTNIFEDVIVIINKF